MTDLHRLKEVISYDQHTGVFIWRKFLSRRRAGQVAGGLDVHGYWRLNIDKREWLGHRLAWLLHHNDIPSGLVIDHVNGNRSDNRLSNLRCVTQRVNAQNRSKSASHSKSGLLGASWHVSTGKYRAAINVDGVVLELGYFSDPVDAHKTYMAAKQKLHAGREACRWMLAEPCYFSEQGKADRGAVLS